MAELEWVTMCSDIRDNIDEKRPGIDYHEVERLGFKKKNPTDNNFKKQYGYDWFWMEKVLLKKGRVKVMAEWSPTTRLVEVYISKDGGMEVIERYDKIDSIVDITLIIEFFNLINKHK